MKAYDDATGQGAYNTLFNTEKYGSQKVNELKERSKTAKNTAAKAIFNSLKYKIDPSDYDAWHKKICGMVVSAFKKVYVNQLEPFFTFGNAQKWVNMTMKYLWLLGILPNNVSEDDLHIPIDRYIIYALNKGTFFIPEAAWSTWNENDYYDAFRKNDFSKYNATLEWENTAWIEQAEQEKMSKKSEKCTDFFE